MCDANTAIERGVRNRDIRWDGFHSDDADGAV